MSKTKTEKKFGSFIKKNFYYIILVGTLVSIMAVIFLNVNKLQNGDVEVENSISQTTNQAETAQTAVSKMPSFQLPVLLADVIRDYSDTEFVNFSSLGYYATHQAIDFSGENGTKVFAIADGTVQSITSSEAEGTVVKISHSNGFVSTYASLDSFVNVKQGQTLKKGAQIGLMSNNMKNESELGVHLHFEMSKDGKVVDPNLYLNISNK